MPELCHCHISLEDIEHKDTGVIIQSQFDYVAYLKHEVERRGSPSNPHKRKKKKKLTKIFIKLIEMLFQ